MQTNDIYGQNLTYFQTSFKRSEKDQSIMRIFIPTNIVMLPFILCGPRHLDCTHKFKNRIASFEYNYYQGYWMYPYHDGLGYPLYPYNYWVSLSTANALEVKSNTDFQWIMHDCGDSICLESKREGWKDYFMVQNMGQALPGMAWVAWM